MPPFNPRYLPQQAPSAPSEDNNPFSTMSDEELAAIAAGAPGPSSQQDAAATEDGDLASIMSLLLGGEDQANPAQSQEQVDFENQLAILELLQAEQGNQQEVPQFDLRQGSNYNPIDGGNEIAASTMYTRNNLASIADQQARQRNRADAMWQMQNQPVAAAPQRAGLSELLAQASSLYDLLKRKPAAEAAPTAAPVAEAATPQADPVKGIMERLKEAAMLQAQSGKTAPPPNLQNLPTPLVPFRR